MHCPHCGVETPKQTDAYGAKQPYRGAASLCFYCAEWGVFDSDGDELYIRLPTDIEQVALDADPDAQTLVHELRYYKSTWN